MNKLLIIFLLFLFSISSVFSFIEIDSCSEINESILDVDREVRLNSSINSTQSISNCINFATSNVTFDCQNFNNYIEGDGAKSFGIYIDNYNNITIQNCQLDNFVTNFRLKGDNIQGINLNSFNDKSSGVFGKMGSIYLIGDLSEQNYSLENILIENGTAKGLYLEYIFKGNFTNISILNSDSHALYLDRVRNSNFKTFFFNNTGAWEDVSFQDLSNHNILDDFQIYGTSVSYSVNLFNGINNTLTNFIMDDYLRFYKDGTDNIIKNSYLPKILFTITPPGSTNNYFYNNIIENSSLILNADWSVSSPNYFNSSTIGNYYKDFNATGCTTSEVIENSCTYTVCTNKDVTIDAANNIIDYFPVITTSGSGCVQEVSLVAQESSPESGSSMASIFPAQGFVSILITFLLIIFFLK